jgi:abortive infection alpha-like protein
MGDGTPLPYENAIEETAKAANNAVDLVREGGRAIGPAIGNIYGLLIGDKVVAARTRRLDEITRKTKKILQDRDVQEKKELPEDIAIPLLEAAQGEPREELQELWARLLANAMDPARANDVRPEFIDTVRKLQPIDTKILSIVSTTMAGNERLQVAQLAERAKLRPSAAHVSVEHLVSEHCLQKIGGNALIALTTFGTEFMIAVAP